MIKKIVTLKQLPVELFAEYTKHGAVEFKTRSVRMVITTMRTKSNVADINGYLYFFGNTYNQINPYKSVTNYKELVNFCNLLAHSMDDLIKGHITDISYLSVSDIMNDGKTAEKLLTVKDTVYPDYTVELLDKDQFEIMIDEDRGIVSTDENGNPIDGSDNLQTDLNYVANASIVHSGNSKVQLAIKTCSNITEATADNN